MVLFLVVSIPIVCGADQMFCTGDNVIVREAPRTDADEICRINIGEEIESVGTFFGGKWTRVRHEDGFGYIYSEYLSDENPLDKMEYLGNWRITAYAATGSPCANGSYPQTGYTIACNSLDFGTRVYIVGVGERTVEDRGPSSLGSEWIDLYLGDSSSCYAWGDQRRDVYLIKEEETE